MRSSGIGVCQELMIDHREERDSHIKSNVMKIVHQIDHKSIFLPVIEIQAGRILVQQAPNRFCEENVQIVDIRDSKSR